jgi:hypothetical protein
MPIPYRARLDERAFLNYPGFHGGAYVLAYVEDTSGRECEKPAWGGRRVPPTPCTILEIADCHDRINLEFDVTSETQRANSLHKVETLLAALHRFRDALEAEGRLYGERERVLAQRKRLKQEKRRTLRAVRG